MSCSRTQHGGGIKEKWFWKTVSIWNQACLLGFILYTGMWAKIGGRGKLSKTDSLFYHKKPQVKGKSDILWAKAQRNQQIDMCAQWMCVLGFNVAFNNFSVISRRCLVATGRSMLTFIVLPHWSIMSQTLDMIPHPVTLSWHWVDQY